MTIKLLGSVALFLVFAAIVFGGGYLYFYQGSYSPPPSPQIVFQHVDSQASPSILPIEPPANLPSGGLFLVDALHRNAFRSNEIVTLRSRVANRGYDVEFLGNFTTVEEDDRLSQLEDQLRRADSFLVILPRTAYSEAEASLVEQFVRKGGKLLLISDPTRPQQINTLAERFGLAFQPGYLYNQVEHDLNFQHIYVREFQPEELTAGLDTIALYTAGSIQSSGPALAFADANTKSTVVGTGESLNPMAWGNSRNVVSIADLTFMIPPQNSMLDNDRLVSNIADYLTNGNREFYLADFPHFFERGLDNEVDILLGQTALLSRGTELKKGLSEYGISSNVRGVEDVSRDTVFLGLHEDVMQVSQYLQAAGVRIDDTLSTPFGPDLELEGTAVTVLDRNQGRSMLILLSDTPETLDDAVNRLLKGDFRDDLVSDFAGVSKVVHDN